MKYRLAQYIETRDCIDHHTMGDYLAEALAADKLHKREAANRKFAELTIYAGNVAHRGATWQIGDKLSGTCGISQALSCLSEQHGFLISDSLVEQINSFLNKESEGFTGRRRYLLTATKDE